MGHDRYGWIDRTIDHLATSDDAQVEEGLPSYALLEEQFPLLKDSTVTVVVEMGPVDQAIEFPIEDWVSVVTGGESRHAFTLVRRTEDGGMEAVQILVYFKHRYVVAFSKEGLHRVWEGPLKRVKHIAGMNYRGEDLADVLLAGGEQGVKDDDQERADAARYRDECEARDDRT